MPLSTAELAQLSRLLDEAQGLAPEALEAWLAALPPAQAVLVPHLRRALAQPPAALDTLPRLEGIEGPVAGEAVGPYRLLHEIGRGGMGTVWLAERADGLYARQVALKLPRLDRRPGLAARMARERAIAARLEHPHIARLYDAGIAEDGRPYLVLEHVAGLPLAAWAARERPGREAALRLLLQACDAVAHAHAQLVVHRDIKPSNLMVDVQGRLRLLDFGIARRLDEDDAAGSSSSDQRRTHTPGYAAPEQVAGAPAGTAADQFALAVVLHELLTGRRPTAGRADRTLGRDLATVLDRALAADPAARHPSVAHLGDELQRVLAHQPLRSDPGPWPHRVALLLRRRRGAVAAGLAIAATLAAGGAAAWHQQAIARDEALRSAQAREFLFDVLEDTEPLEGQTAAEAAGPGRVRAALERARSGFAGQPALRGDLLVQLGLMLRRSAPTGEALQVLEEGHALLQAHADAGDPALARARAQLAQQLLEADPADPERAAALARSAIDDCRRDALRCAKARAYAHHARMQVALRRGDLEAAVDAARASVAAHAEAFGADDAETVLAQLALAGMLREAGRLEDASRALAPALAAARTLRLRQTDRVRLQIWAAVIEADLGRPAAALDALAVLLDAPGTAAADRATAHRLRSQALLTLQRAPAALTEADAAQAQAEAADLAWERALAAQARGRALSALGRHAEAAVALTAADAGLAAQGLAPEGLERLRLQRLRGEAALRAGDRAAAEALLTPLPAAHGAGAASPRGPLDLAQALDLLGTLARLRGEAGTAVARHAEAAVLLAGLPAAHPLRRRHALAAALAALAAGGPPDAVREAARQWIEELPADAGGRQALQRLIEDPASGRDLVY